MTLYEIIKALQKATGRLEKEAIMYEHHGDTLFKNYMKAVYDPAINYYIAKAPKVEAMGGACASLPFAQSLLDGLQYHLADRNITGKQANNWLLNIFVYADVEARELLTLLIKRSIGASVGETMVLKTWPGLFFVPGYMRCSLMTPKIRKHFESLDEIIVQKKADGSYICISNEPEEGYKAFTRAGSHYPTWMVEKLSKGLKMASMVIMGELVVYNSNTLLNRQEGNGILNSILSGEDESSFIDYSFKMEAWDCISVLEYRGGYSGLPYHFRLADLKRVVGLSSRVFQIETSFVSSLEEAYEIYSSYTADGKEGVVVKDPSSPWKDGTSPLNVKLKIDFEIEVKIIGMYEGEGKYKGMLGGINYETSDGLLKGSVGTGFDDIMRRDVWAWWLTGDESLIGRIITVKANDVVSRRDSLFKNLFLPVFVEIRNDKYEADSLERVMEQLEAAKSGGSQ